MKGYSVELNFAHLMAQLNITLNCSAGFSPPANTPLLLADTLNFGIDGITDTINPWKPGWNEGGDRDIKGRSPHLPPLPQQYFRQIVENKIKTTIFAPIKITTS